jgi:hypothetical protein
MATNLQSTPRQGGEYIVVDFDLQVAIDVDSLWLTCSDGIMAASEPPPGTILPSPIFLVKNDGRCVVPTGLEYTDSNRI